MTATANLPTAQLIDSLIGNYQGSTRRITLTALAALLGDGSGSGAPAVIAQLQADMLAADAALAQNIGKIFPSRAAAFNQGRDNLPTTYGRIVTIEGDVLAYRAHNATADDPLFAQSPQWGVEVRVPTIPALRRAGVISLETQSAAGNYHTARIDPALVGYGDASLVNRMLMSFRPIENNTGPAFLTIASVQAAAPIVNSSGQAMTGGELRAYRTYILEWVASISSFRVVAGDVTPETLDALQDEMMAAIEASAAGNARLISGLTEQIEAPYESSRLDSVDWFVWDRENRGLMGWSETGLRVILDDATLADVGPRILGDPATEAVLAGDETMIGRVLLRDAEGRAVWMWRTEDGQGFDAHMHPDFWARGRDQLLTAGQMSTTKIQIGSYNGQSLTVGGLYVAGVLERADLLAQAGPGCLQIAGLRRADDVEITDTLGARSVGYDVATAGTGLVPAVPGIATVGMAMPTFAALNAHRADLGAAQIPVITSRLGVAGVPIEDMDDEGSPATVWQNFEFWTAQAQAQAAANGLDVVPGWHCMTHGTSAKSSVPGAYAALWWDLQADSYAYHDGLGLPRPRYMITQPGGDANTTNDGPTGWAVCDDVLDICEQGGAVLGTPMHWHEIADDNVHPDALATVLASETCAWAMAEVEAGHAWTIRRPTILSNTGGRLVLDFVSLREDETLALQDAARYGGVGIDAFAGFQLPGGTITGLMLRGRTAVIDYTGTPTAVRYARQVQDVSGTAGNRYTAHRGLLRTTLQKPSKLVPGRVLQRAIPTFQMEL